MKVAFLNKTENFCPTKMKYFYAPPLWLTKFKLPWSNYIYYYGFSYYFCWFVTLQVISTNLQYRLVCFFPDQRVYVASHAIEFNVRQIFDINITIVEVLGDFPALDHTVTKDYYSLFMLFLFCWDLLNFL